MSYEPLAVHLVAAIPGVEAIILPIYRHSFSAENRVSLGATLWNPGGALDQTSFSTAVPVLSTEFQAADLIPWTNFVSAIEIGSLVCGLAPDMPTLIAGRAIAGIRGGGIVSLVAGGAFTDSSATWRWCFYINLPPGGFVLLVIIFILCFPKSSDSTTFASRLKRVSLGSLLVTLPALYTKMLGGSVGLTIFGTVFNNRIYKELIAQRPPQYASVEFVRALASRERDRR
ncbi:hypothetical protein BJ742DRAFT_875483 [Cladochytrium replicatum]|nr:hypothetical protein BJ742DRAFT_875483 [Cladochytrium replicatum]